MATNPVQLPYQTALSPDQEASFQSWVKQNKVPWQDGPTSDYDLRGYYKAQQSGDDGAKQAPNGHYPDTYKTPYHKTFSNESQYATPNAPAWHGNKLINNQGQIVADEDPIQVNLPIGHQPINTQPITNLNNKKMPKTSVLYGD